MFVPSHDNDEIVVTVTGRKDGKFKTTKKREYKNDEWKKLKLN